MLTNRNNTRAEHANPKNTTNLPMLSNFFCALFKDHLCWKFYRESLKHARITLQKIRIIRHQMDMHKNGWTGHNVQIRYKSDDFLQWWVQSTIIEAESVQTIKGKSVDLFNMKLTQL